MTVDVRHRIGMLGAGAMGLPMVRRLIAAGHDVLVWARSEERADRLREEGIPVTMELARIGERPTVVSCLLDEQAIESVLFAGGGLAGRLAPGTLVIEHATVAPAFAVGVAERLQGRGVAFCDAPVSGGPRGAAAGELVAMVGTDDATIAAVESVLASTCSTIVHAGPVGSGSTLKVVNQFLVAAHSVAAAEAAVMLSAAGVDALVAREALLGGWAASRRLDLQLVDSMRGRFDSDGAGLGKFLKDLDHVSALASGVGLASALLPGIRSSWDAAAAQDPDASFAALVRAVATVSRTMEEEGQR